MPKHLEIYSQLSWSQTGITNESDLTSKAVMPDFLPARNSNSVDAD